MNIKELKEYIKDLPDYMEVKIDKYNLIGWWHYEFEWLDYPQMQIEDNIFNLY